MGLTSMSCNVGGVTRGSTPTRELKKSTGVVTTEKSFRRRLVGEIYLEEGNLRRSTEGQIKGVS